MSKAGRTLKIGDKCKIDWDLTGRYTYHKITGAQYGTWSQSGICFTVEPPVPKTSGGWIDADWFEPVKDDDATD